MKRERAGWWAESVGRRAAVLAVVTAAVWLVARAVDGPDAPRPRVRLAPGRGAPAVAPQATGQPPLETVDEVFAPGDRRALLGRRVRLARVRGQAAPSTRTLWVGTTPERVVLVTFESGTPAGEIRLRQRSDAFVGRWLVVSGILRELPVDVGAWRSAWEVDDQTAALVREAALYVAADAVTLAPP